MTSQTPVVLVSLPNLPYLLGTFDTTRFRTWWRSAPFPDDIENLKKGFHIYGRTHLAIARRKDGRWAIYRSKNYGVDWERVFLASAGEVIYDLVLITYGRAVMNTSLGFYETVNAGTTWNLVLGVPGGAPNAPAFCNIGGGDILMCTDGRYIWRSTDIARSWSLICDMTTLRHSNYYGGICYYNGPSAACIAGANGRVLVSHGAFLVRSDDAGVSFGPVASWERGPGLYTPPRNLIYDRMWDRPQNPGFIITQLIISSVDGLQWKDVAFLAKIDDIVPVYGTSELFSWVLKTWADNEYWKPVFQQYITPTVDGEHLCSYDVAVMGASYNDKLVFSAQTRIDSTGRSVPSLKYSVDGGATWTDVDLDKVKVGDPSEGGVYYNSIIDDTFAKLTWTAPPCNNHRTFNYIELYHAQCQSYELDVGIKTTSSESYQLDTIACSKHTKTEDMDVVIAKPSKSRPYNVDALAEGQGSKIYRIDRTLEGTATKEQELDAIIHADNHVDDMLDAHILANIKKQYHLGVLLKWRAAAPYSIDTILVRNRLNERLSGIEREIVQFVDIDVPTIPYSPLDSRKETL